jgi:TRAP-type mannitol/chloroaromatic compound transport system substrate-binding protein
MAVRTAFLRPLLPIPDGNAFVLQEIHEVGSFKRLIAVGALLRPFSQDIMEACYKATNQVYAETGPTNPRFKKLRKSGRLPQRQLSVVAGGPR